MCLFIVSTAYLVDGSFNPDADYEKNRMYPFYGVYYGQSALPLKPDTMYYITNNDTEKARVYYYNTNSFRKIYKPNSFKGLDPYNVFLSGPVAMLTIENENAIQDKELIIFRDSFGSSLAPLLIT